METKSWKDIKNNVYGEIGTERRDELERDFEGFKIGLLLKKAREEKKLTQTELGGLIDKKREYISRIENNGSNLTLKSYKATICQLPVDEISNFVVNTCFRFARYSILAERTRLRSLQPLQAPKR